MSVGPTLKEEAFGISKVVQAKDAVKATTREYFSNPVHYLFYGMLTATCLGLFVNMHFSIPYYSILVLLGCAELVLGQEPEIDPE